MGSIISLSRLVRTTPKASTLTPLAMCGISSAGEEQRRNSNGRPAASGASRGIRHPLEPAGNHKPQRSPFRTELLLSPVSMNSIRIAPMGNVPFSRAGSSRKGLRPLLIVAIAGSDLPAFPGPSEKDGRPLSVKSFQSRQRLRGIQRR